MTSSPDSPRPISRLTAIALASGVVAIGAMLFATAMCRQLIVDEEQYLGAAEFARTLSLYRDLISFQPPVYTHVLSLVFEAVPEWHLLAARALTAALGIGSCMLLLSLLLTSRTPAAAAFVLVVAFVNSPFLDEPLALARNDILTLFLLLLGLRMCLTGQDNITQHRGRIFAAGFFLALAGATKYTYLFAAPVVAAVVLHDAWRASESRSPRYSSLIAFLFGSVLGFLPVLYQLVANFDNYVFSTLLFHRTAPIEYWRNAGRGWELELGYRMRFLTRQLLSAGNLTILAIGAWATFALLKKDKSKPGEHRMFRPRRILLAALLLSALVFASLPAPTFALYYPAVAALGVLLVGDLYTAVQPRPGFAPALWLVASLLPSANSLLEYVRMVPASTDPSRWAGVQTHRLAGQVADLVEQNATPGPVATLFPVTVMDANPVLSEFASGPWFFRSAHLYEAQRIVQLRGVGPATLEGLLDRARPVAIVAGYRFATYLPYRQLDGALIDYARRKGYRLVRTRLAGAGYRNGQLWVRPSVEGHSMSVPTIPAGR